MPRPQKNRSPIEAVLHAVLLPQDAALPLTPKEVADYDARHRAEPPAAIPPAQPPSPRFSWERKPASPAADNVVAFRSTPPAESLAYAARAGNAVSLATRAKLARLVKEMKRDQPHA